VLSRCGWHLPAAAPARACAVTAARRGPAREGRERGEGDVWDQTPVDSSSAREGGSCTGSVYLAKTRCEAKARPAKKEAARRRSRLVGPNSDGRQISQGGSAAARRGTGGRGERGEGNAATGRRGRRAATYCSSPSAAKGWARRCARQLGSLCANWRLPVRSAWFPGGGRMLTCGPWRGEKRRKIGGPRANKLQDLN
jgi:hypothetical protein